MCGIVGYIGARDAVPILLDGLKELEYRGYDSAGIALLDDKGLKSFKAVGKLKNLADKMGGTSTEGMACAIGHTRWATHGKPTEINAHPHGLSHARVVHNGIIENYAELRARLNTSFISQTDTEVIVHLFEQHYQALGNTSDVAAQAFHETIKQLHGSFAILLLSEHLPGHIFFARKGSPLQVSLTPDSCYFASSDSALVGLCESTHYLRDDEWGIATANSIELFSIDGQPNSMQTTKMPASSLSAQKEGHRYFMEKEIYEQGKVVKDILLGRIADGKVFLEGLDPAWLAQFSSVSICACGTSYHAALTASYLLERMARVPVRVAIASEFRYRDPVMDPNSLFIVISQSGETADTFEALKLAQKNGVATLALCNVDNSSIVRSAEKTLLLRAGIEKGVASTKAFSAQVMSLWLLAVFWAQAKNLLSPEDKAKELAALQRASEALTVQPKVHENIRRLSKRYLHGHGFFFIGRDIFYPLALEGALKLKEISYLHAEGYPAGEMKHGPIALADSELFTIALMAKSTLYDKVKSNVEELSARDSTVLAISTEPFELADDLISIRAYEHPMLEFMEMLVVVQLLSMEIAIRLGNDVDMPRNLAKSVTVE